VLPDLTQIIACLAQEGDLATCGQRLVGCQAQRCWQEAWHLADFPARKAAVEAFNKGEGK
jgi:hypothetical protein